MIEQEIRDQILRQLDQMPRSQQIEVLKFAINVDRKTQKGTPGKDLLRFFGAMSPEDCDAMTRAIEESCERIDPDEW